MQHIVPMNQLIPLIEHDGKTAVNLRDLHTYLEVKKRFTDWAQQMFDYGFTEGQDYVEVFPKNGINPETGLDGAAAARAALGGRPQRNWAVTLDTAKEIAMIQRTDKGKQARQYFIEVEKRARQVDVPQSLPEALRRYADEVESHQQTRQELETVKPLAEAWDTLAGAKGDYSVAEAAQVLSRDERITIGRNRLFEFMGELGWLYRHGKRRSWHAYQPQVENGRIVLKMSPAFQNAKTGELERPAPTIRLTAKGVEALRTKLLEAVAA